MRLLRTRRSTACSSRTACGAAGLVLLLTACGAATPSTTSTPAASDAAPTSTALRGTVTVLAAASLTESFDQLAKDFEAAHPGVTVETSYGSSATLVQQVNNGAPASVIALAGTSAAAPLDRAMVKDTKTFATNTLEIAVPPANPGRVAALADLAKPSVSVVLCADTVPCGKAAQATFTKAGVVPHVVSKEVDVKATLAKVKLGEADAAVVYHSDVVAAKTSVTGITIDPSVNTTLTYPVVTLTDDPATTAFVAYLLSAPGLRTVQSFGFGAP
ncbi:MAG: Molybdenum transporter substrate-binding protein [Humibacillus sp.]|nr:Molybdenum transporter substrate-binding protein [Humibacillus sp.]